MVKSAKSFSISDVKQKQIEDRTSNRFSFLSRRAGIPAVNENGDLLLLYVGIIDILQNYRLRKKLEHAFKSTLLTRVRFIDSNSRQFCFCPFSLRKKFPFAIQHITAIVLSSFYHNVSFEKVKFSVRRTSESITMSLAFVSRVNSYGRQY